MLPEPYHDFQSKPALTALTPTVGSLFDCSFADNKTVMDGVFWNYACEHSSIIRHSKILASDCRKHNLSSTFIKSKCAESPLRAIKMIRGTFVTTQLNTTDIIPPGVSIVHVVRSPWSVFRSQFRLGWLRQSKVPAGADHHEWHMGNICSMMTRDHEIVQNALARNPRAAMTIRWVSRYGMDLPNYFYVCLLVCFKNHPENRPNT